MRADRDGGGAARTVAATTLGLLLGSGVACESSEVTPVYGSPVATDGTGTGSPPTTGVDPTSDTGDTTAGSTGAATDSATGTDTADTSTGGASTGGDSTGGDSTGGDSTGALVDDR